MEKLGQEEDISTTSGSITGYSVPASQQTNQQPTVLGVSTGSTILSRNNTLSANEVLRNGTILSASDAPHLTPAQQAIQRGFSDGFMTAKMFAQQGPGMSRLGFKWQYVEDSLVAHGSNVAPGKEGYYREWFDKGLTQGEAMVAQVIGRMSA